MLGGGVKALGGIRQYGHHAQAEEEAGFQRLLGGICCEIDGFLMRQAHAEAGDMLQHNLFAARSGEMVCHGLEDGYHLLAGQQIRCLDDGFEALGQSSAVNEGVNPLMSDDAGWQQAAGQCCRVLNITLAR